MVAGMESDPLERAKTMRQLARAYHAAGFNIVPLGIDKRPVKTGVSPNGKVWRYLWDDWQTLRQSPADLQKLLSPSWWCDVYGVAGVCGFDGWVCLDLDAHHKKNPAIAPIPREFAEAWLYELGIKTPYDWLIKSPSGGWHIWMKTDDVDGLKGKLDRLAPDEPTVEHIELRWFGHYVALPGSLHSRGAYEFAA